MISAISAMDLGLGLAPAAAILKASMIPLLVPEVRVVFGLFGGLVLGFAILWDALRVESGDWL